MDVFIGVHGRLTILYEFCYQNIKHHGLFREIHWGQTVSKTRTHHKQPEFRQWIFSLNAGSISFAGITGHGKQEDEKTGRH
jgi:hypothetical protein